jgi:hypothetical protein
LAIPVYFGVRAFGRIDDAEGGWSATRFFHVYHLPLIPVGGVRCLAGPEGQRRSISAPIELKSVGLAYFKWLGFLAAAGLMALAYNEIERPPGATGFVLGAAALALFAAVVSSWVWIGDRAATAQAKAVSLAMAVALAGGVLGWAVQERLHRQSLPSYQLALLMHQATGTSDLDWLYQRLGAVVAAESAAPPPARDCGERFLVGRFEGKDIMSVERGWLQRLVASRGHDRDTTMDWLASRPLQQLTGGYPEGAVFAIGERPYLAVLQLHDRGPTDVRIYDLLQGGYACGTRFTAPRSGFLEAFAKAVDRISPQLHLETTDDHVD